MKTHVLLVVDESGSMGSKRSDVIEGCNTFISDQRKVKEDCIVSLVKFNTRASAVYSGKDLEWVPKLDTESYAPGGNTALYDAIAESVHLGDKNKADRTICVIVTDGEENSSRETTFNQVKELIQSREKSGDWTFVYLGTDPDLWAKRMGTSIGNTQSVDMDDIKSQFAGVAMATCSLRASNEKRTDDFFHRVVKK